jgi:starvation-inducible DNA-binding protein
MPRSHDEAALDAVENGRHRGEMVFSRPPHCVLQQDGDNPSHVVTRLSGVCETLQELCADNLQLMRFLRATHDVCDRHDDVATAGLIEGWIDQSERRT